MGRRHLAAFLASAAAWLVLVAPAGAGIGWRVVADGQAAGAPASTPKAYLAADRPAATAQFSSRLTDAARAKLARFDFSHDALLAIFGEFGCSDHRIAVSSIGQSGAALEVKLVERPPAPGTVECMAIYQTYRFLAVAKASLGRPFPTSAKVSLARA